MMIRVPLVVALGRQCLVDIAPESHWRVKTLVSRTRRSWGQKESPQMNTDERRLGIGPK